jgi:hypothetical protein
MAEGRKSMTKRVHCEKKTKIYIPKTEKSALSSCNLQQEQICLSDKKDSGTVKRR